MVIYAIIARVSVLDLFLAGIIPGLLLGGACAVVVWLYGRGGGLPRSQIRVRRSEVKGLALDGVLVASLPLFIVFGTLSGAFTPTEAGGIAVVYAIGLGMVVYRHLSLRGLWDSLKNSIRITATLYLVLSTSEIVSTVFAFSGMQVLTNALVGLFEGQPVLFMLALVAIFAGDRLGDRQRHSNHRLPSASDALGASHGHRRHAVRHDLHSFIPPATSA